jgi:glycosyltransferase involved in cell wall biosynthesis
VNARPLVSVVIPVYNGARFLAQAIDSVLAQTYPAIEVVVVDDGSTDDSRDLIARYGDRVVAVSQANGGVARARNAGIRASRGELVAFLDQDDWWRPEKIAAQVRVFQSDGAIGLVHTGVGHYDEKAQAFVGRLNPHDTPHELVGRCYERLLLGNSIYNATVMVRRAALDVVGHFDASIAGNTVADYELWLRLAQRFALAYVPEELAVFRLHADQGTWKRRDMLAAELRVVERALASPAPAPGPAIQGRLAQLLEELGVAHLDAGQPRAARPCFARALVAAPSLRRAALLGASGLPVSVLEALRKAWCGLRIPGALAMDIRP